MTRKDKELKELEVIENWALSCETKEQLNNVSKFLNKKIKRDKYNYNEEEVEELNYHLGFLKGTIRAIEEFNL